ncbi:MAG TPA: Hpt domain-containing protein, partial [Eubacterium sp.]|nr:Hpt domain-containing protein [Eubacterium sp.]
VGKVLADERLITLEEKLTDKDYDAAFEIAHALKGMYSNLSLTPLAKPIIKMTELLRAKTDTDYSALLAEAKSQFEALKSL